MEGSAYLTTGARVPPGAEAKGCRRKGSRMQKPPLPPATFDGYVGGFPRSVQTLLRKVRRTIETAAPDAQEAISYGIPTFVRNGKKLVWFAAFKSHIGFYPGAAAIGASRKSCRHTRLPKARCGFPSTNRFRSI